MGNIDYFDSNIDVVCLVPLEEVFRRAYPDRYVTTKDRVKAMLYEHNKLMLTDRERKYSEIHLHTNAGWHDCEFVSGEEIMAHRMDLEVDGQLIQITDEVTERKILTLHQIFENFFKKRWDNFYIGEEDYDRLADAYGIPASEMARIKAAVTKIPIGDLRPIWRRYYAARRANSSVTLRSIFLHWLSVALYLYRENKKARDKAARAAARSRA
jgi:hypothetical protein